MGGVQRIEVEKKRIPLEGRTPDYDFLVLATGMTHAYFGNDKWAEFAPGQTIGEALDIRRRILRAFEAAELEPATEAQRAWTTFVVASAAARPQPPRQDHHRQARGQIAHDEPAQLPKPMIMLAPARWP